MKILLMSETLEDQFKYKTYKSVSEKLKKKS